MVFHNVRRSGLRQVKSAVQAAKAYLQVKVKCADVKCSPEGGNANEKTATENAHVCGRALWLLKTEDQDSPKSRD